MTKSDRRRPPADPKFVLGDDDEVEVDENEKNDKQQPNNDGPSGVILWDLAVKMKNEKEDSLVAEFIEKNVIFVGSRNSGKSTIILNYTDRSNETPKPTNALDYTFCRKAKTGSSVIKLVGHIWELGEGTFLLKLIDVVVNPENLLNTSVIITLDLSRPQELWITLETVIAYLKQRVKECVKEASKDNSSIKERLKKEIQERLGGALEESKLEPLALPTAIIGTKYDEFEKFDPQLQKIITKTLRFVAHFYGTALIFSSSKNEITSKNIKTLLNSFLLDGTFQSKTAQVDSKKPIFVPFGTDSFEKIGLPELTPAELNDPNHKQLIDLWKYLFCSKFKQEEAKKDVTSMEDYGKGHQYEEPVIDVLKEQKMRELENLRELLVKRRSQNNEASKFQIIN